MMGQNGSELLHGTLEALILKTVASGRRHGYGIARSIEEATDRVVEVEEGSLYPALYRLERKGLLEAEWGTSELGRRAKFYRITPRGRKLLTAHTAEWARFAGAISKVLLAAG
jgi:PadR family transcriptional regulator